MTANQYDIGDRVRCQTSTAFTNSTGQAFDPDVVNGKYTSPSGTSTTYVYGTDEELIKAATGDYYFDLDLTSAGTWYYRIEGLTSGGNKRGADENWLIVKSSQF